MLAKKRLEELERTVQELSTVVGTLQNNEIATLRKESKELKELKELLAPIKGKIGVKNAKYLVDADRGIDMVRIEFEFPSVTLEFLNGKQATYSDLLKALNVLNFVALNDQMTIAKEIEKAKERSKND